MRAALLVIDDDVQFLRYIADFLQNAGYQVDTLANPYKVEAQIASHAYQCILLDLKLPGLSGLEVLELLRERVPEVPVIAISGEGRIRRVVKALKKGAYDFIEKPVDPDLLLHVVARALEHRRLVRTSAFYLETLIQQEPIIARDEKMLDILATVQQIAPLDVSVLITGETGTGKGLIARLIHYQSARKDQPFVTVNCAAIPGELMESVLFGHVRGAFTGAVRQQRGKFLLAHKGTIFLDEVAELPPMMQAKLLHVLQEGEVDVIGEEQPHRVDVRVIAATNRPLDVLLEEGSFRLDLYHRLAGMLIHLPPLRERKADILPLAYHFLQRAADTYNKPVRNLHPRVEEYLLTNPWKGNVRELQHVIERLVIFAEGPEVTPQDYFKALTYHTSGALPLPPEAPPVPPVLPIREVLEGTERVYLERVIKYVGGDIARAAELLQVDRSNLYRKLRRHGLRCRSAKGSSASQV